MCFPPATLLICSAFVEIRIYRLEKSRINIHLAFMCLTLCIYTAIYCNWVLSHRPYKNCMEWHNAMYIVSIITSVINGALTLIWLCVACCSSFILCSNVKTNQVKEADARHLIDSENPHINISHSLTKFNSNLLDWNV